MTYSRTAQAQAITAAAINGDASAARELGIPRQTINRWRNSANTAELGAFVLQKKLEAAAEIADRLPGLLARLLERVETTLEQPDGWNGTQLQAAATALGILADKVASLSHTQQTARFGQPDQPAPPDRALLDQLPSANTPEATSGPSA